MINVTNVEFSYESHRPVIENCSFSCTEGEVVALIGPSGEGKSTLLKLLASILSPQTGSIHIEGSLSYMPQEHVLLPWRTALDNVLLPCEFSGRTMTSEKRDEALCFLKLFGLQDVAQKYPNTLSGGMQRRVALARTLMQEPRVILLDEPLSSVDIHLRERFFPFLQDFVKKGKRTLLFVTHDFRDAALFADRVLLFKNKKIATEWKVEGGNSYISEANLLEALREAHKEKV